MEDPKQRRIKSFVLRTGRMTARQKSALEHLWSKYALGPKFGAELSAWPDSFDYSAIFNRDAPLILEIGFGMGDSLVEMAYHNPDNNYLGIEVHTPGIGSILNSIEARQLSNLRIFHADAILLLQQFIANNSLSGVCLFFPDPWHKKRHHKRRIVNSEFVQLIHQKLQPNGFFHMATDWENYAEHMLETMQKDLHFVNQSANSSYIERPIWRPETKFEKRGVRLGHGVWDLLFRKNNSNKNVTKP